MVILKAKITIRSFTQMFSCMLLVSRSMDLRKITCVSYYRVIKCPYQGEYFGIIEWVGSSIRRLVYVPSHIIQINVITPTNEVIDPIAFFDLQLPN